MTRAASGSRGRRKAWRRCRRPWIMPSVILTTAVPAHAVPRLRKYKGQTSQAHNISFLVAKTDAGRFIRGMQIDLDFTCEDQTTQGSDGVSVSAGTRCRSPMEPSHSTRSTRPRRCMSPGGLWVAPWAGTLTITLPALTADEQAQLCTTGDLTWEVDFLRTIPRAKVDAPAGYVARTA